MYSVVLKEKMLHLRSLLTILKKREERDERIDPYMYSTKQASVNSFYEETGEEGRRVSIYHKKDELQESGRNMKIEVDHPAPPYEDEGRRASAIHKRESLESGRDMKMDVETPIPVYQKIKKEVIEADESDVIVLESSIDPVQDQARGGNNDLLSVDLVTDQEDWLFGDVGEQEMDVDEDEYPVDPVQEENIPDYQSESVSLPPWKALPVNNNQFSKPVNQFNNGKDVSLGVSNQFMKQKADSVAPPSRPAIKVDEPSRKVDKVYPWTGEVMRNLKKGKSFTLLTL
jgi:hypothetical protein